MKSSTPSKIIVFLFAAVSLLAMTALCAYASPANPFPQEVEQADGSTLTVTGFGDEYFNWVEDSKGKVLSFNSTLKSWCYAYITNGKLAAGSEIAVEGKSASVSTLSRGDLSSMIDDAAQIKTSSLNSASSDESYSVNALAPSDMSPDLLVLLIEYTDTPIVNSMSFWWNRFFSTSSDKTVNSYYSAASNGLLQFEPAQIMQADGVYTGIANTVEIEIYTGVVRVKLNKEHPVFDKSDIGKINSDISLAFDAVKDYINLDSYYSVSGSNYVRIESLKVSTVIAGWEASNSANQSKPETVWAHYYERGVKLNGEKIRASMIRQDGEWTLMAYTTQGELYDGSAIDTSARTMGIGVTVHELGHSLGLPDLYDYGSDSRGLYVYSRMGAGNWGCKDGEYASQTPTMLDAWSRCELGFVTPVTVDANTGGTYDVKGGGSGYTVLKVTSSVNKKQYFLVENRQITGYDEGMTRWGIGESYNNGGILIYHVDEEVIAAGGRVNSNKYHKAIDIISADNSDILNRSSSNSFTNINQFYYLSDYNLLDADTTPNSNFYVAGHTSENGGAGSNYKGDNECHPRTVKSGIIINILSDNGGVMTVSVGDVALIYDVNGDGSVNILDIISLAGYIRKGEYVKKFDFAGGGKLDSDDSLWLLNYILTH